MVIYSHISGTRWFNSALGTIFLFFITLSLTNAQTTCPDPGGGKTSLNLGGTAGQSVNIYPGLVPSGQTGIQKGTVGYLYNYSNASLVYPANTVTINPLLNGVSGGVALRFEILSLVASQAKIEIFKGTSATGTPVITLTEANRAAYEGTSVAYNGPVTLRFTSPTPAASGNFNFEIRFMTGDQIITSSFNQKVAVWTQFIQPNSYTFIDDFTLATANTLPISIGYFDASRTFVSAEIGHCTIHDRKQIGVANSNYPGGVNFQVQTDESNFDRLGSALNVQQLKMARVAWIIANAPKATRTDMLNVRNAIWTTMGVDYTLSYGGIHDQAKAAVPTVPSSSPAAPALSMSASAATAISGKPVVFTLNVTGGTAPLQVKLDVPAGMTINSVTGATYSGGNLTISSSPATVQITATSATQQSATLKAIFSSITSFYNPDNFKYYIPCEITGLEPYQDFLGYSVIDQLFPVAQASATWLAPSPLACTDGYYQIDNGTSLYSVNVSTGTRTFITSVSGDFNAMGYSAVDNFLWGYDRATNQVFKLGSGSELFMIPNMPAPSSSTSRTVGTVDLNGYLYLYEPNATEYITIDINAGRNTYLQIVDPTNSYIAKTAAPWGTATTARNISDWAYNPLTGLIHAMINGAGSNAFYISQLNPVTGVSTLSSTPVTGTLTGSSEIYDSQFFDANGNLMVYPSGSGHWYLVNSATNVATQFLTIKNPISTGNDGAACPLVNAPTSFACSTLYYQVDTDKLYSLTQTGTRTLVATLSGSLDAIGYNTQDNMIWGYDKASAEVFRLGANGVIQRFTISGMPAATQPDGFSVGTVNANGYLFLYEKNGLSYITIDINPARSESYLKIVDPTASYAIKSAAPWGTTLSGGARGISDWAYNPVDNLIYALTDGDASAPFRILQVNPLTGATTLLTGQVTGASLQTGSQNFGSSFFDATGTFTVFGNTTGHLYRINTTTKVATQASTVATPSATNDGAFCTSASSPPLPVVLVSFEAVPENTVIRLNWSTASESNNSGFEIERSSDAKSWNKQGFVSNLTEGGNSSSLLTYHFTDGMPLKGINYYRLKMIDFDGTFAYSRIRSVTMDSPLATMITYPNPVSGGKLMISIADTESYQAEVHNMVGTRILRQDLGKQRELNVSSLASGIYILSVKSVTGNVQTSTFVVK